MNVVGDDFRPWLIRAAYEEKLGLRYADHDPATRERSWDEGGPNIVDVTTEAVTPRDVRRMFIQ